LSEVSRSCTKTGPTGDLNCPPHVHCAKLINKQLVQMIEGLKGGSDRSNSGEDESESEDALEDPRDLVECFEGVGQVEGLVGDGCEVLGGEVQGVADDDGGGNYGGSGENGVGVKATVWRALAGVRIVLEMAAVVMTPLLVETMV
jgi:hypothetical protein